MFFDGAAGNAEFGGDICVAEILEFVEHEDAAAVRGEAVEGGGERCEALFAGVAGFGGGTIDDGIAAELGLGGLHPKPIADLGAAAFALVILGEIEGHLEQVAGGVLRRLGQDEVLELDIEFLYQILGFGLTAQTCADEAFEAFALGKVGFEQNRQDVLVQCDWM